MLAIILAAGRGSRMGHLTKDLPKPMLRVLGKTLIEWKLEALPEEVSEVILIVGYLKEVIKSYFGNNWRGKHISYVEQREDQLLGTGYALHMCMHRGITAHEKTLVLMGDDIYDPVDLDALVEVVPSILVAPAPAWDQSGRWQVFLDEDDYVTDITEDPPADRSSPFINAGAYCIDYRYFDPGLRPIGRKEFTIPHTLLANITPPYSRRVHAVRAHRWIQVTHPESIIAAEMLLKSA